MSYEPKEWVSGETITANGLNNLEEGVQEALDCCGDDGDGTEPLILRVHHSDEQNVYYDKTLQDVYDALAEGRYVVMVVSDEYGATQMHIVRVTSMDGNTNWNVFRESNPSVVFAQADNRLGLVYVPQLIS